MPFDLKRFFFFHVIGTVFLKKSVLWGLKTRVEAESF